MKKAVAEKVFSKMLDEIAGDSISDFFEWRCVDADEFYEVVEYLSKAIEQLPEE